MSGTPGNPPAPARGQDVPPGPAAHARHPGPLPGNDPGLRAVARRAQELEVEEIHQGAREKIKSYEEILKKHSLNDEEVCFIGDDIIDIPVMRRVGLPVAVADAHEDILPFAIYQTSLKGGQGAVREVTDLIIKAQGKWQQVVKKYLYIVKSWPGQEEK